MLPSGGRPLRRRPCWPEEYARAKVNCAGNDGNEIGPMSGARIACPRCGSNNFDTVTACWKCGTSLSSGPVFTPPAPAPAAPAAQPYQPAAPTGATQSFPPAASAPKYQPSPVPAYQPVTPVSPPSMAERIAYSPPVMAATGVGNPAVANRAAFWLGMLMPYFGLPIALAFMMCDDRRRQEVGRICLIWSIISSVVHLLLFFVSVLGMREYLVFALGTLKSQAGRGGGLGGLGGGGLGGGGLE